MKYILSVALLLLIFVTAGKDLLPFQNSMFTSHDSTQPARILDFTFNIYNLQLPPRIAPHWSFGLGFPVFNFYAPTAYWITSSLHLLGLDVIDSLKLSYLFSMFVALGGMYLFLRRFFAATASLLGGVLYSLSPWIAVETFVRGNLAEMWFIALLPLAFFMILKNAESKKTKDFVLTALVLGLLFSVHNVLSLFGIVLSLTVVLIQKKRLRNAAAVGAGILLSAYFLLPAILELPLTYAAEIAKQTKYSDHFLCAWQMWTTPFWGYGGSAPGCVEDGMSFMIGKIQIIFGLLGLGFFILRFKTQTQELRLLAIFIALLGLSTAFLTTYASQTLWNSISVFALFQFPWRFLIFPLFATTFFAAFLVHQLKLPFIKYFLVLVTILYVIQANKYFHPPLISKPEYSTKYASEKYITEEAAYAVPEYLPRTVNYRTWLTLKGNNNPVYTGHPYERPVEDSSSLPFYPFSFWKIETRNNTKMAVYTQSPIQQTGNIITIATIILLGIMSIIKIKQNENKPS